ncbi:MAG: NosD domain-containing protein [Promethearchaeota archaeon]
MSIQEIENDDFNGPFFNNHDPISITGNQDFHARASSEGWRGNGLLSNPYVIENLRINGSGNKWPNFCLISIKNTDVAFIINNCLLIVETESIYTGIHFQFVSYGLIVNNTISNIPEIAVELSYSSNNSIINNTILSNRWGVVAYSSPYNYIAGNTISNNEIEGIQIEDSENILIMENDVFSNVWAGIYLSNASNSSIIGNRVFNNQNDGIVICDSPNALITNNVVKNNYDNGILLGSSPNSRIIETISENNTKNGIDLIDSQNCTIAKVESFFNDKNGIYLDNSLDCKVTNSYFINNTGNGVNAQNTYNSSFENNTISKNFKEGCSFSTGGENKFMNNLIKENHGYGVSFLSSEYNSVIFNNFICNNQDGDSQAEDSYYSREDETTVMHTTSIFSNNEENLAPIFHNVFTNNFWNDWQTPDKNNDSLVDQPYSISGNNINFDWNSLVTSHNLSHFHFLSIPRILHPKGGAIYTGEIEISWLHAIDTDFHKVTYSVYFSNNSGHSWMFLKQLEDICIVNWQTEKMPDGVVYTIKVIAECTEGYCTQFVFESVFSINNSIRTPIISFLPSIRTSIIPFLPSFGVIMIFLLVAYRRRNRGT